MGHSPTPILPTPNREGSLAIATALGRHERYTFDAAENHVSQQLTDGKVPELKVFESNGLGRNQVAPIGGPWLEWDDNGNLTRKGDFHYKWDFRNRLVRVTRDGVGEIAHYEYDAFDRRVVRTVESVEHQTSWAGWQALETRKAGALVDRRVYGVGLDEVVAIGLDVTGDGAIDGAYVPLYDSSGNVAVLTGSDGRVVERYDYRAFGPRETRVDSVRPQLTSERIASSSFVVSWDEEISGEVLSERIGAEEIEITLDDAPLVIEWSDPEGVPTADGGLAETKSAAKSTADVVVSLPVEAGRRTLRFAFTSPPAPGAEIVVTLPAGAIEDYYNNATTEPTTFSFTWPASDTILNDTRAPRLDRASVIEGCVELVFDEEIDPATWSAATIDQGAVDWASCENDFGLCQQTCLAAGGSHTLELGATLADLAGNTLDGGAVGHGFDLSATDTLHIWRRPDPRLLTSATGSVVDKSVSSAVRQALGFHGLPIDPETGLVYVRHRYYDPEMGRFLSQDPLGYVDGGNLYQYGLNNPGDFSDPLGLQVDTELSEIFQRIQAAADEAARAHGVNNRMDELLAGKVKGTKIHSEMQRLLLPGGKYYHPRIVTEVAVSAGGTVVDFARSARPEGALVKDIVILKPGLTAADLGLHITKARDITMAVVDLKVAGGAAMRQGETLRRFGVTNIRLRLFSKLADVQGLSSLRWARKIRGIPVLSGVLLGLSLSEAKAAADSGDLERALIALTPLDGVRELGEAAGIELNRQVESHLESVGALPSTRPEPPPND